MANNNFSDLGIRRVGAQEIQISKKGIYIWVMPDGRPIMNEDADVLNVQCEEGDLTAIADLRKKALWYGGKDAADGTYKFIAGSRRLTDDEFYDEIDAHERGVL